MISIIIPIYNEFNNINILYDRLVDELSKLKILYEVIFVDDGSTDNSLILLEEISYKNVNFKFISLSRNYGQTAAIMAGINYSTGNILIPMDGDLQNDPSDINNLIAKLDEGFDVVSGWRINRKDTKSRKLPSMIANIIISKISGVKLHDYGCTLKAYRKNILKDIRLYGEMHRFIPIYAYWQGAKIAEIPVKHNPRIHGFSKYGMERIIKVILDLIVIKFIFDYSNKPIYIFGTFGIFCIFVSFMSFLYSFYLKYFYQISFIETPLLLLTAITFITGFMSILMGLIAEILMRTYYESQNKNVYSVKKKSTSSN
jgi:glycosyltransferase involved in cell wall biosynthesis